ncbi:hypothetical protein [Aequorivita echinoideorum]|uniref:Uncharacterized protein n=1 Tax=Aequorivita echinoideorum TaxID=1549647 RepID=A0ABS5S702_9FLAO|nr:hypothetical protein [Aequorivita echinoideorum]MBT0607630.1 hypothetical protein [Aequorivita echinoideorum]
MITDLCNIHTDFNYDTFAKIRIIEISQIPAFSDLHLNTDILFILNNLPETVQAMDIPLLPEKFSVRNDTKLKNSNKIYDTKISFPLLPMDRAIKDLLETYNNKLVIALLIKQHAQHLYGTQAFPLLFTYDELHANNPAGIKGYQIEMGGSGYGAAKYFTVNNIMPDIPHLAFTLAGTL